MTPEPSPSSRCSGASPGELNCRFELPLPKNWRNRGSSGAPPSKAVGILDILVDSTLTTAGNTFFTIGAKPVRLGPSSALASLSTTCGFTASVWPAAKPTTPMPTASAPASITAWERLQKILFVHIASIAKCQSATVLEVTPGEVALPDWTAKGEFGC